MLKKLLLFVHLTLLFQGMIICQPGILSAKEGSRTGYHLGSGGPMAGFVPPPGFYMRNDVYYYSGESDELLPVNDNWKQDISSRALLDVFAFSWVTDTEILGGALAVGAGFAYGTQEFWADLKYDSDFISGDAERTKAEKHGFWNPGVGLVLGWHEDTSHWQTYTNVNIPIGTYDKDSMASLGRNRWAFDVGGGYTYLNLENGHEISTKLGFVFHTEDADSDFTPGIESHLELALVKHLPSKVSFGMAGYYYRQVTEDDGDESLGSVLGQVAGLGPMAGYYFNLGETIYSLNLRAYHEFAAEYRLEGDSIFFSIGVSL